MLALDGTLKELEGDAAGAVEAFAKAAAANRKDLASRWSAARLSGVIPAGRERAVREIEAALKEAPVNVFLLARLCEDRREEGDRAAALEACGRMARAIEGRDAKLEKYVGEARAALEAGDLPGASLKYRIVENLLRATAEAYAKDHSADVANHFAAIESDLGAEHPLGFHAKISEAAHKQLSPVQDVLSPFGASLLQLVPQSPETDIEPLAQKGVPAFGVWQNGLTYFMYHHTPADTLDKVVPEELRENAACMAVMGYALADMAEPLQR